MKIHGVEGMSAENIRDAVQEYLAALEDRFQGADVRYVEI